MSRTTINAILNLVLCMLMLSCANMVAPTGGPRDVKPPKLKKRSMNDSSVHFTGGTIEFEFDEFVQVKDVANQLLITPLLKKNPKITAHKKKVRINLDDSLLEKNTTYVVSLGNAIQDMREGNPYKNLNFTFSTGAYFDSLSLKGLVIDAQTGKPDTACMVLLYPYGLPDSAFAKQKPLYVQKVTGGLFEFKNLPSRDFTIYALQDLNKNYRYDMSTEKIAFQENKVNPKDTSDIFLYTFIDQGKPDTTQKKGIIKTQAAEKIANKIAYFLNADTAHRSKRTFDLNDSLIFHFDHVLKTIDNSKIKIYQDSLLCTNVHLQVDSSRKNVSLAVNWTDETLYKVVLMKGFVQDSSGLQSNASEFYFRTKRKSDYGFLSVRYKPDEHDMIELLRNDIIIARKNAIDSVVTFPLLNPDNYQIRVLHDENKNGHWDSGSFFDKKRQPELTEYFPGQITIKANWENKIDLISAFTRKPILKK